MIHCGRSLAAIAMLAAGGAFAQPDVQTIIQRSLEATKADWSVAPQYSYQETDREDGKSKTYEVRMIEGSPYGVLIAVDGQPLTADEQQKEQEKLKHIIAKLKSESPDERARRIEDYEKDRKRDHAMLLELAKAFDFKLIGETQLAGREVYLIQATPRPDYQPPNDEGKVLTGMQGRLWIDKATSQLVQVTAEVIHPVFIEGFLARVEPGTRFELQQMQVADGVWLPKHFAMYSRAKVLGVWDHIAQEDQTFSNYQKSADSQTEPRPSGSGPVPQTEPREPADKPLFR
jgi:hypothetical protein